MNSWAYRRRESRAPALAAAFALHAALFLALIWFSRPPLAPMGTSVPVNLVATGPTTNSRPAVQAAQVQEARADEPVPQAKPPQPAPSPPRPPAKTAPPRPAPPRPAPAARPAPQSPRTPAFNLSAIEAAVSSHSRPFSLNALQSDLARSQGSRPARPAYAPRGPTRAETALESRVDAGTGVSQNDIAGLSQLLERLWNPDCSVDEKAVIPVRFTVGYDGRLQGPVDAEGRERSPDPVVFAAARRAIDAVHQAAPYADTYRGLTITVRFDARKACADR